MRIKRQSSRLIAALAAMIVTVTGCTSEYNTVVAPTSTFPVAGGNWSVPDRVGIGGHTLVTDADAVEILNDPNASPAYTYYVRDRALLEFSREGTPTEAEMLDFSFNAELLNFYRTQADEQRPSSSPEVQELNPVGVALYRKVDNGTTVLVRKITGPRVGEDAEMCANSGTGNQRGLGVCRVVRDGNIYLFEVRGLIDETEGKMLVNDFLMDVGLVGLTES